MTPWTPARLLSTWGFSKQEYWSGLPCPHLWDLLNPGIEPRSPALLVDSLPSESPGKNRYRCIYNWVTLQYNWNYHNMVNQLKYKTKSWKKQKAELDYFVLIKNILTLLNYHLKSVEVYFNICQGKFFYSLFIYLFIFVPGLSLYFWPAIFILVTQLSKAFLPALEKPEPLCLPTTAKPLKSPWSF